MTDLRPYTPRPYQQRCIAALAEARAQGETSALVVMASGLGKTPTLIFDLEQYLTEFPDARVLFLCDQETILVQSKAKFRKYFGEEYSYGLYSGSHKTLHRVNFMFATLQSVRDHPEDFPIDAYDYIAVDEAHHSSADTYAPTIQRFQYRFLLGLTATPDREDGRNILDIYGRVVFEMDVFDGWAEGYLAPTDYRLMLDDFDERELQKCLDPEYSGMKISMAQLNRTIFAPKRDDEIVAAIREQTADLENPRIFVFCNNIQHAETMAEHFGGEAAVVHSGQSSSLNFAILSAFQAGQINIVISVNMLNEGVDVPEADCVVFLRVTDVKRIFFQQLGRGLRLSTGKRVVRVLDFVSAIERIVMILEMEETAKQRIKPESSSYPFSAKRLPPITVNVRATKFRIKRVDIESLLRRLQKPYKYRSDEELLHELRLKAEQLGGRMPTGMEIDSDPNMASAVTYNTRFGGLAACAALIGLDPAKANYSDEQLLSLLRKKAAREGKTTLAQKDLRGDPSMPDYGTYVDRFNGFDNALILAGLNPADYIRPYEDGELLRRYAKKGEEECGGEAPTMAEVNSDPTMPHAGTYLAHFKTWENLRKLSGLKVRNNAQRWHNASDQELLDALKDKTERDGGYTPTAKTLRQDPNAPSYELIVRRFGGLDAAFVLAGLTKKRRPAMRSKTHTTKAYTEEELIANAQAFIRQNRRKLKVNDFGTVVPSRKAFSRHVGTCKVPDINAYVGADQILAELATENN